MQARVFLTSAALMMLAPAVQAQLPDWNISVSGRGFLSTSSRIYTNPDAPSFDLRARNTPFTSGYGAGVEVRFRPLDDNYFLFLSAEYLTQSRSQFRLDGSLNPPLQVPIEEGYLVIPIELGGQVYIPVGSLRWKLTMGGGIGIYYAERLLTVAGVRASPVGNAFGAGIHVGLNVEITLRPAVSFVGGLKFRDPEINVQNTFDAATTTYNNSTLTFPPGELRSRINVDGLTIHAGVIVEIT